WPMAAGEFGRLTLDLTSGKPLLEILGIAGDARGEAVPLLRGVEPVTLVTVGTREAPPGRPPEMSVWNPFFDRPAIRPHQTYHSHRQTRQAPVTSDARRA